MTDGGRVEPAQHWDFVDEDGCLHCNCGRGVVAPDMRLDPPPMVNDYILCACSHLADAHGGMMGRGRCSEDCRCQRFKAQALLQRGEDAMTSARFDAFRDDQILGAGDTKHICCGCGGLCDSKEPCPMAFNCICNRLRMSAMAVLIEDECDADD